MTEPLSILCWKWKAWPGTRSTKNEYPYSAAHVNTLSSMLKRNLTIPYRLSCITDNGEGIDKDINIIPLWNDFREMGGCFTRLKVFDPSMKEILGEKIVSIDLDVVIVDNLDELFSRKEDFIIWGSEGRITPYCGSLWMLKIGKHSNIWYDFHGYDSLQKAKKNGFTCGSDQAILSNMLYPKVTTWTFNDGIYNFSTDIKSQSAGVQAAQEAKAIQLIRIRNKNLILLRDFYTFEVRYLRFKLKMDLRVKFRQIPLRHRKTEKILQAAKLLPNVKNLSLKDRLRIYEEHLQVINSKIKEVQSEIKINELISPDGLPMNTKLVFFNGKHDPSNVELQKQYPWIGKYYR